MSTPTPVISFPPELPVSAARHEIARAISKNQVVIVAGATGSGKTTQLPKICLELGRTKIAHTQPRRIAARSIAERVAQELEVPLGTTVGYKVRFTDKVTADTRVALMTDGILLNEIHRDRLLRRYDTIIIDEAHERSLNIDFLLGYLTRILPKRPDLKIIVTSATIDPQSFAQHFADAQGNPAPIIEVSGRTYPVEVRYRPPTDQDDLESIVGALRELDRESAGDVLVFLPGESEIRDAADAVRGAYAKDASPTEVLPLYGRLSASEQHRVFEPSRTAGVRRRVILATNVAETSLTVPGIRYVIDTGVARITRYSVRNKIQRLPIEPISQASAQQRAGRAGRTAPGIAIRLYSEEDFASRAEFTDAEILRTSLASVILQMLTLGFGDLAAFPFLTPPDSRGVKAALELLHELGAVRIPEKGGAHTASLTDTGREIARLPIDPRFARMLVEAQRTGVLSEVLPIIAGLSIQDVRERPEEVRENADRLHARFTDPTSDFLTLLNLWNYLQEQSNELGSSAFRRLCRTEYLNYVRVREWFDVHRQLSAQLKTPRSPSPDVTPAAEPDAVHRAIMSGLLSHLGVIDERAAARGGASGAKSGKSARPSDYLGARGTRFAIFPGSGLKKKRPEAVMAAELVETSRLFARTVAAIDPAWAEQLAPDLVKRQQSDPHWSKAAGAAVAAEKVTLFGLEIIPRRRVQLARYDRELAREMFLRHALVEEEWDPTRLDKKLTAFVRRNFELRRRLEKIEERERRRDILVGDEAVYAFYDARIPADVFDVRSFESWWKTTAAATPRLLDMSESDLVDDASRADERDFPTRWTQGDQVLSLAYRFEPGADDDGVTVVVPLALLPALRPEGFDWQVPGLRPELITGLLRALPKALRRHVVPAADWAATFAEQLSTDGPEHCAGAPAQGLRAALAARVQRVANQPVTVEDFEMDRVPSHLHMSFRAVDERGRSTGSGRDLRELQQRLAARTQSSVSRTLQAPARSTPTAQHVAHAGGGASRTPSGARSSAGPAPTSALPLTRSAITTWDFGDLPEVIDSRVAGGVVRGYPALVDERDSVAIRVETTLEAAQRTTTQGVLRLLLLAVPSAASYVLEHLTAAEKLALAASPYASARALIEDCRRAVAADVLARASDTAEVRTAAGFDRVRAAFADVAVDGLFQCVSLVARILTLQRDVERAIKKQNSMTLLAALGDTKTQITELIFPGFIARTGIAHLAHLPRYLQGALTRVQTLADNPGRDRTRMTEYERASVAFAEAGGTIPLPLDAAPTLVRTRWLLEEYRVSLFAQSLGTAQQVSLQRIHKALRD